MKNAIRYFRGPYLYEPETFDEHGWIHASGKRCIAAVNTPDIEDEDSNDLRNSTGHLLAAAPAMYEAIQKALDLIRADVDTYPLIIGDVFGVLLDSLPKGEDQ